MKHAIGPIFSLNRKKANFNLKSVAEALAISQSKLSNFENERTKLSDKQIKKIYHVIGMEYNSENDFDKLMEKVSELTQEIYYGCCCSINNVESKYQELLGLKNEVSCSYPYITWMLGEFIFHVYYGGKDFYDYFVHIKQLSEHIDYLDDLQKQIFFDTLGIFYEKRCLYEEAVQYFNRALYYHTANTVFALTNYHKARVYIHTGNLMEALEFVQSAKQIFDKECWFRCSFMCIFELANIYMNFAHYEKAEREYLRCIKNADYLDNSQLTHIYNNCMWNYLLWKKYDKVLSYGLKAIKINAECPMIYFHMAYANWRLKNELQLNHCLDHMQKYLPNTSPNNQLFIQAFLVRIKRSNIGLIEKKLMEAYEANQKVNYSLSLFTLELLVEIFDGENNDIKVTFYKNMILDAIKNHRKFIG